MQPVMVLAIEDGEQYQTGCTNNGGNGCAHGVNLLPMGCVWCKFVRVSQPALENEGEVESDDGHGGHGDKHSFEVIRTDILRLLVYAYTLVSVLRNLPEM
jgi:hypothetical protein